MPGSFVARWSPARLRIRSRGGLTDQMDQSTEALLYPYVTTPKRIALDLVDALAACPAVSRVAIFGSLANGEHDGWSDIDAICAVEGEDGAWQAAAALRQAMPLRWHGLFSATAAPSGRHWLLGESVFHSIDLTYASIGIFEHTLAHGVRGHALLPDVRLEREGVASPGRPIIEVVSEDYDFTHALYITTKAMRDYLRARRAWDDLASAMKALETAARGLAHRPAGSDPDDVMNETRTLYYALMQERARYGGES